MLTMFIIYKYVQVLWLQPMRILRHIIHILCFILVLQPLLDMKLKYKWNYIPNL